MLDPYVGKALDYFEFKFILLYHDMSVNTSKVEHIQQQFPPFHRVTNHVPSSQSEVDPPLIPGFVLPCFRDSYVVTVCTVLTATTQQTKRSDSKKERKNPNALLLKFRLCG